MISNTTIQSLQKTAVPPIIPSPFNIISSCKPYLLNMSGKIIPLLPLDNTHEKDLFEYLSSHLTIPTKYLCLFMTPGGTKSIFPSLALVRSIQNPLTDLTSYKLFIADQLKPSNLIELIIQQNLKPIVIFYQNYKKKDEFRFYNLDETCTHLQTQFLNQS